MDADSTVPDTERHWLIALLPPAARPYGLLGRFDRPIGWWLLFWPSVFLGVALLSLNFVGDGLRDALDPKRKH